MAGFVLFETTDSVIEVLWDIALSVFIVRIALVYFLTTYTASLTLSYLVHTWLLPSLDTKYGTVLGGTEEGGSTSSIVLLITLLGAILSAYFIVRYYDVPRTPGFRLAIGVVAVALMAGTEAITNTVLRYCQERHCRATTGVTPEWVLIPGWWLSPSSSSLSPSRTEMWAAAAAFALIPATMMVFESGVEAMRSTWHGHEKKAVKDAVPKVSISGKVEASKKKSL